MDTFHKTWIYCLLTLVVGCTGCSMFGGDKDRVCPEGLLKKVEYETVDGERVIKSVSCYPKDGQRP